MIVTQCGNSNTNPEPLWVSFNSRRLPCLLISSELDIKLPATVGTTAQRASCLYQDQDAILYWLALVRVMSQFYDILANEKALGVAPVQRKISLREKKRVVQKFK